MNDANLNSSKKLFFTALWIDIAVTAIVAMSAFWAIDALKEIQSGALTYSQSLGDSLQFWENFAKLAFLTLIGVGLALVKWLNACYRFAKDSIGASGFKNEGWTAWGWIVPIINLFKPYQITNEIYKAGAPGYRNPDDWKNESGSGLLLTWWIFWVASHLLVVVLWTTLSKASRDDLTMPQALGLLNLQIGVCVLSIVIAVMWLVVANHLTGRLLARRESRVSGRYSGTDYSSLNRNSDVTAAVQSRGPSSIDAPISKAENRPQAHSENTAPVSERQMQAPQPSTITESSNEEDHWAAAMAELETGQRRPGLWAKAFAESDGDETKAKVAYLKSRVQQLIEATQALFVERENQRFERQRILDAAQKKFRSIVTFTPADLQLLVRESDDQSRKFLCNNLTGHTLLHACAGFDMLEEIQVLLKAGADPKQSNKRGERPAFLTENWTTRLMLSETNFSTETLRRAQQLGVTYVDGMFGFDGHTFQQLPEAIEFAAATAKLPQTKLGDVA